ncbi:hypothetical protein Tco_1363361 [Tanacetum coccineum]
MQDVVNALKILEGKIEVGTASPKDRESRIKLLQVVDKLDNLEAPETIQKARIKWDMEGDENTKFFHHLVNQKRRNHSVHGIMHEGVWVSEPHQVKKAFLNFFKDNFQANDNTKKSRWRFGIVVVIKLLVPNRWELLKTVILKFVNSFFATRKMPSGSHSSFITLVPRVSNPVHIKYFRPISLIGIHYKIIAKNLANRLSKVIDKTVSHEQSDFIAGHQILDGPLMLSEPDIRVLCQAWFEARQSSLAFFVYPRHERPSRGPLRREVSEEEVSLLVNNMGCALGSFPFVYLDLPIESNMNLTSNWKLLLDRVYMRLSSWNAYLLTIGGRLMLIKVKVIKALHGQEGGFDLHGCKLNGLWAKIVGTTNHLHSSSILPADSLRFHVGCGTLIRSRKIHGSKVDTRSGLDTCVWSIASGGVFTIATTRRHIDALLLPTLDPPTTWDKSIPCKVKS